MQIAVGNTVHDRILDKTFLSWEDVSGRIQQLLKQGEYAPQSVLDAARDNALKEHAQTLLYMERDLAEGVAELVFADTEPFRGGFPEATEKVSALLDQPEYLADLNERLAGLAEAFEMDKELMRFPCIARIRWRHSSRSLQKKPFLTRPGRNFSGRNMRFLLPRMRLTFSSPGAAHTLTGGFPLMRFLSRRKLQRKRRIS